jgi:BirA family biotin operon repressor/biotin-[acetyl-CoA-carboxylase] ligase
MKFKIISYDTVNNTNETAIDLIKRNKFENGFVYALSQKKGKGQYGRKWISKKGNLFGSIFFHLKKNYPSVEEFSLINPILNINVVSNYCGKKNTFFKSPNDIYINKKKICGILQEVIIKGSKKYLIVGIGINILSNPKITNYPSTNIYKETKKKPRLLKIIKQIIAKYEQFFYNLDLYKFSNFKLKSEKLSLN